MKVRCVCQVNPVVQSMLCVQHVFLLGVTNMFTTMYYDPSTDVQQAMQDCHVIALQTANIILSQYNVELSEE